MATHQGALLLFSWPEQSCCLLQDPQQPPPVSSMLASQTSPPGGAENRHTNVRTVTTCPLHCAHYDYVPEMRRKVVEPDRL